MSTPTPVQGFILAGGQSRRMGRDKSLLDWHGCTLLEHMTVLLRSISEDIRIVGRKDLPDEPPGLGPIGGISTALAVSQNEHNIVVAVDLPLLTSDFLKYFKERFLCSRFLLTVCRIDSRFPLCVGLRRSLRANVDNYIASGQRSLHGFIEQTPCEVIAGDELAGAGWLSDMFLNINSETDYEAALAAHKP